MDALNYPYIRVRDVEWLKQTLLLFPHVARMTPEFDAPPDAPEIEPYCWEAGGRHPLLRPVDLMAGRVWRAQDDLIRNIEKRFQADEVGFRSRFGREAFNEGYDPATAGHDLWGQRLQPNAGFQIHRHKVVTQLRDYLLERNLAWRPERPHGPAYIELHPRLGTAVMTTLAFAAAQNEGLTVVTEFPDLHGQVIADGAEGLLDRLAEDRLPDPAVNAQRIAEVIVYQRCDVSRLGPEDLVALRDERAAFARFRQALEAEAKELPAQVGDPRILQEYLDDTVNAILGQWQKDRAGFTPLAKAVFGDEAINEPKSLLQKIAEKAFTPEVGGPAASGVLMGSLTAHTLAGAAAGCAIGLAVHTLKSWRQVVRREADSPWKYLTTLERGGVGFRMVA
ncbi:hypothetical protein [Caulobacter segnis]|uniref:Uncharacterized protein n=1 Tax=Caulobacter segnis TaxID=88688 RepID=A0A2W5VDV5_9CAUL|nr:hypothetical protein [Caulobacter segnis]PZR36687.1 MAG: hypothetical protein DI526_03035 [Caulobacter segnis]